MGYYQTSGKLEPANCYVKIMRPLSAIAQMQRWNELQDKIEQRQLEHAREKERYEKYRETTIEEIQKQLELYYKKSGPIDIWV